MNNNRMDGRTKQLKGSLKEAVGKLTGSQKLQAEGAADKLAGKGQDAAGTLKNRTLGLFRK